MGELPLVCVMYSIKRIKGVRRLDMTGLVVYAVMGRRDKRGEEVERVVEREGEG